VSIAGPPVRRQSEHEHPAGVALLFLPPYSPDLDPIEMTFAKLKAHLRRIGARNIEELWCTGSAS
jgi:transposase